MPPIGPEILGDLLRRIAPALELYARQWCDRPEDIVQEAFIRLAVQDPPPDRIDAWLFRVVRNGAISASRSTNRRRIHERRAANERPEWFASHSDEPLDGDDVSKVLASLPAEEREAIVAHLWGGLSFAEIAELSGSSSTTIHRKYQAGLERMRERLASQWKTTIAD